MVVYGRAGGNIPFFGETMTFSIDIIIVSWNTKTLLANCLHSVVEATPPGTYKIWVVDNGSTDGTQDMLASAYPQVRLIQNQENVGFARANNQAINEGAGKYVLLLNPDTIIHPGSLEIMKNFLRETPSAGAVGPLVYNPNGTLQTSAYPAPTLFRELWRLFHLDKLIPIGSYRQSDWEHDRPREVENLLGACILVRRSVLNQIGLFDEHYFMYSEEIDLCFRMRRAGWQIYWLPEASIVHFGGQSTHQVAEAMFLELYRGKILYFKKHYGLAIGMLYKLIILLATLVRFAFAPFIVFSVGEQYSARRQLLRRYWTLLKSLPAM